MQQRCNSKASALGLVTHYFHYADVPAPPLPLWPVNEGTQDVQSWLQIAVARSGGTN